MSDTAYLSGLKRNIRIYYIQKFLVGLEFFLPVWVAFELKFTNFAGLAILETIQALISIVSELPTGAFADIFGRKKSIAFGMFATASITLLYPFSPSFLFLAIAFACWGITTTFISGADTALLYDSLKDLGKESDFAKITSKASLITRIAIAIGTLLGGYLYNFWNPLPYILYGLFQIAVGIITSKYTEPKIDSEKFTISSYFAQTFNGVREAFKNQYISLLSIYYIIIGGFSWAATFFFSNIYAQQNGFGPEAQSILFFFIYIIKSFFGLILAHIEHLFNRKNIYLAMFTFTIFSFLPAFFVHGWYIVGIILATEFVSSLRFTLLDKYVNQEFESRHRATALSFLSLAINLIYVLVVFSTRNISNTIGVGAIYSVLGAVCLVVLTPVTIALFNHHRLDRTA